jgi:hypothetical protein
LPVAIRIHPREDAIRHLHAGNQPQLNAHAIGRKRDLRHLQILIQHMRRPGKMNGAQAQQTQPQSFHRCTSRAP